MTKLKKHLGSVMIIALFIGMLGFAGCSGVSDEQMAQLESVRTEVTALSKEVNSLKSEKTKLERKIAEKNAKLEQCNREKAKTRKNLEKINNQSK